MRLSELPYEQFALLGVTKDDLIYLPTRVLSALLNGQRTSLIRFTKVVLPVSDRPLSLDARLSIDSSEGKPTLKIYPIQKAARNVFSLSEEEIGHLKESPTNFVVKQIKVGGVVVKRAMIYLDHITNEHIAINKDSLRAPQAINGVQLTTQQQEAFKAGEPITINEYSFRINPNSEIGLSCLNGDDTKIEHVQFLNSRYSKKELALDLAHIASGMENMVLLEHLASIALYTAGDRVKRGDTLSNLSDPEYWEAINGAAEEIKKQGSSVKFSPHLIAQIVNKHLEKIGVIKEESVLK